MEGISAIRVEEVAAAVRASLPASSSAATKMQIKS
jgi:hypothetical protein